MIKQVVWSFDTRCGSPNGSFFLYRKPCSAPKWKEMTGSGIFAAGGEVEEDESTNASVTPIRTAPKNYQVLFSDCADFQQELEAIFLAMLQCR